MKKILFIIIAIIYTFSIKCYAQTILYIWENTTITLEVNSPLEDYLDLPKVSVYASGQKQDVKIYYSKDYTYTTINTVTTHLVGTYFLDYKAEIPYYDYVSKQRVYFNVVDTIPPIIQVFDKTIGLYETIDILKQVKITDNYSSSEKIKISYDKSILNNKVVGIYRIKIIATDENDNEAIAFLNITVIDEIAPVIEPLFTTIKIDYGCKDFNIGDYFYAFDNNDSDITYKIEILQNINLMILGEQEIVLSVKDAANNETIYACNVNVVDNIKPILELNKYFIEMNISEDFNLDLFKNFLLNVSDNETNLTFDDVTIDYSNLKKDKGQYEVIYSIQDNSKNETTVKLTIKMNYINEIVAIFEDIIIKKGQTFNYKDYILILKEENTNYYITVADNNVNVNQVGDYYIDIVIYDSFNNNLSKRMNVKVIENDTPQQEELNFLEENGLKIIIVVLIVGVIFIYFKKNRKNL